MAPLVTADQLANALGLPYPSSDPAVAETAAAADAWLVLFLTPDTDHSLHPYCAKAGLEIAVDMWTSSKAAGGQPVSLDYQPAPYTMGASMLRRVAGLISPCRTVAGMVG